MGFPITIHGVTYNASDFAGLGYVTALAAVLTKLGNCSTSYLNYATSASSVLMGTGLKTFTVAANSMFQVGQNVVIYYNSTNYMYGYVTTYNVATGALEVSVTTVVGAGTYGAWTISRAPHVKYSPSVCLGIYEGGTGEGHFDATALELERSTVYRSGFNLMNLDASDFVQPPYYYTTDGATAVLKGNATVNKSALYLSSAAYGQVQAVNDQAFCSLGSTGFLSLQNCGDLMMSTRFSGDSPTATENYVMRIGFATNNAADLSEHEQYGAFGAEVTYGDSSVMLRLFCNLPEVEKEYESTYSVSAFATNYNDIAFRYNHLNQELTIGTLAAVYAGTASLHVDLSPFIEKLKALGGSFRTSMLLRPFFYMKKTVGTAVKAVGFQDFEIQQYLRRS